MLNIFGMFEVMRLVGGLPDPEHLAIYLVAEVDSVQFSSVIFRVA